MSEHIQTDLERARDAICLVLERASARVKSENYAGWQEYFADCDVVEVSLSFHDIRTLGAALKDSNPAEQHAFARANAKTLGELITPRQVWLIRSLGRELEIDIERECRRLTAFALEEINRRAATALIEHLKAKQGESDERGIAAAT
ncbi:MAG: hypothetical protein AB7U82_27555 [Blastocatellales bacterium]